MKKDKQDISAKTAKRDIKAKIRKRLIKVFKAISAELALDAGNPPFDLEKTARKLSKKMAKHAVLQKTPEQTSVHGGSGEQNVAIPAARKPRATTKIGDRSATVTKARRTRKPVADMAAPASKPAPSTEGSVDGAPVETKQRRPRTVKPKGTASVTPKAARTAASVQANQPSGGEVLGDSESAPGRTGAKRGRKPRSGPSTEAQQ